MTNDYQTDFCAFLQQQLVVVEVDLCRQVAAQVPKCGQALVQVERLLQQEGGEGEGDAGHAL